MRAWLLLLLIILVCCALMVVQTRAGPIDTWVHGSVRASSRDVAGVTVSLHTRSSTTNTSGSWGFYYPLADNQVYTLNIQLPEGYVMTGASGPGITGWGQDCLTFQTGSVGELYGPFVLIVEIMPVITETPIKTPTVSPTLYPPDLWPTAVPDYEWPYNFIQLTAAEQIEIIKTAEACKDEPVAALETRMTNDLWKAGRSMQLGMQETPAFQTNGFEGMGFSQGIVVMTIPRGEPNEFGVISWFGCWACE